jgi:hypothetical protein
MARSRAQAVVARARGAAFPAWSCQAVAACPLARWTLSSPQPLPARQVQARTRPLRSPSPPRLITTGGMPRPCSERLPAGLVLRPGRRTTRGPVRQQCRAAVCDLLSEPPIEAEQVMPDVANIDAGSRLRCRAHQAPDQLCCRLIFLSASLAERSTRSRRSGISWLRSSSPSSRSAWSSSASGFVGLGQTIGLDFFALDKQRSRVAAGFKRPVGARSHANPCCSKGFRHGIATSLLRLRAAVMIMPGALTSSRSLVTAQRL